MQRRYKQRIFKTDLAETCQNGGQPSRLDYVTGNLDNLVYSSTPISQQGIDLML